MLVTALCVVGNKSDLPKELRKVSAQKGREYAKSLNSLFAETSAAHDQGKNLCVCVSLSICMSAMSLCVCSLCVCPCVHMYALHACVWLYVCACVFLYVHECKSISNFQDGVKLLHPT